MITLRQTMLGCIALERVVGSLLTPKYVAYIYI